MGAKIVTRNYFSISSTSYIFASMARNHATKPLMYVRNAMDVRSTVEQLEAAGVRVYCLALGGVDLTSPDGKMTMQVINAVAEFERELLIERLNSGIRRAKAEGKKFDRPSALTDAQKSEVLGLLAEGMSIAQLARRFDTTRQTIMRIRAARPFLAPTLSSEPLLLTPHQYPLS